MNPTLASQISQYAVLGGPAYNSYPPMGTGKIPGFNGSEAAYVFANAGAPAIAAIFSGYGMQRAVFNAALYLRSGDSLLASLEQMGAVSQAVKDAVAAYAKANPALVPTGNFNDPAPAPATPVTIGPDSVMPLTGHTLASPMTNETLGDYFQRTAIEAGGSSSSKGAFILGGQATAIANELGVDPTVQSSWPLMVDCFCNWATYNAHTMAEAAAQDAAIAAEDHGTGSVDLSTLTNQDLTYIMGELGYSGYASFIPSYTSADVIAQKNASMLFDQANPTNMNGYNPSPDLAKAVAAYKAANPAKIGGKKNK